MKKRTKRYFGSVRRFGKYDGKLKISLMFFAKIALLPEFFAKFEGMHAKTVWNGDASQLNSGHWPKSWAVKSVEKWAGIPLSN